MAVEDEDGGRVRISPVNINMEIKPTTVVLVSDLVLDEIENQSVPTQIAKRTQDSKSR